MRELAKTRLNIPPRLASVLTIAAGWDFNLALTSDHNVVGWGNRGVPPGLSNIVSIALGAGVFAPAMALRADGTVFEWKPGADSGNASIITTNAVAIAAGTDHGLALKKDGTVLGWGANASGEARGAATREPQVPCGVVIIDGQPLTHVKAIAAGDGTSIALKDDGAVVAWGRTNHGLNQATVPKDLKQAFAVAAGEDFFLAIIEQSPAGKGSR